MHSRKNPAPSPTARSSCRSRKRRAFRWRAALPLSADGRAARSGDPADIGGGYNVQEQQQQLQMQQQWDQGQGEQAQWDQSQRGGQPADGSQWGEFGQDWSAVQQQQQHY